MNLSDSFLEMLRVSSLQTLYMVSVSSFFTAIFGIPLGVVLVVTKRGHIWERVWFNRILGTIVNLTRSVPFIIFMVAIIPLTRFMVGSSIGTTAAIVPLTLAAIPFTGRLAESAMLEVDRGVIEAAQSAGASNWQIIWKVLLPESRPGLILAMAMMVISLIGYSAMAGAVGGGGLGDLAIRYGYQRYQSGVIVVTVLILMVVVQLIQLRGDEWARRANKKNILEK